MNFTSNTEEHLRAAVRGWVEVDRPQVSAAERLQRLRAAQAQAATENAVRVWRGAPAQQKSWRWLAVAAAVALVAVSWGVARVMAPDAQPKNGPAAEVAVNRVQVRPDATTAVTLLRVTSGDRLYMSKPGSKQWTAAGAGTTLHGGLLLQAAFGHGGGEAEVFQKHRVKLHPGTLIRVGVDPQNPQIQVWHGTVEIWPRGENVRVVNRSGEQSFLANDGDHATASTETLADGRMTLDGAALLDDTLLPAARITHFNSVALPVDLAAADANLLTVITVDMQQQPLSEAVSMLRDALTLRIVLSPAAEAKLGATAVTLNAGQITGGEAIAKLAESAGLVMKVREGEIVLELPDEPKPKVKTPQDF